MKKIIHLTVDLTDEIKESFRKEETRWKNLKVFWTGFSSVHLALDNLGLTDKEGLKKIIEALSETISEINAFDLKLDKIVLGPTPKEAKMFWAVVLENKELVNFQKTFHKKLMEKEFELKKEKFIPHIVLAVAKGNQLKGKKPNVKLKGKIEVDKINIVSSQSYSKDFVKRKLIRTFDLEK